MRTFPFLFYYDPFMKRNRPTIIDVARLAGVSKTTVARVVSGQLDIVGPQTQEKINRAIAELGYEKNAIASSLRTNRTKIIMLSIPDINNSFWSEVARGCQDFLDKAGYSVVMANNDWDPDRELRFLRTARRGRFDGVLINPIQISKNEILASKIPTVIIGNRQGFDGIDMVGSDSEYAIRCALEHLVDLGHRRIGLLLGISTINSSNNRLEKYQKFLQIAGLTYDPQLVVSASFDQHGGMNAMRQLLTLPDPPTAVLGSNDFMAIGALHEAYEQGYQVPQDLSIIGIDDITDASIVLPPLSTIAKQKYELGYQAAELLIKRINQEGNLQVQHIVIPTRLIVRGTTAEAKNATNK
jgi:DNA-binding LacI/PurR family transcriptional regulator